MFGIVEQGRASLTAVTYLVQAHGPSAVIGAGSIAPSPLGRGRGVRVRAQVCKTLGTLTLTLSRRERGQGSIAKSEKVA
jgi:hypothetical protein